MLQAGCPRCPVPSVAVGDGWSCPDHGPVTPLWRPEEASYDAFAGHLVVSERAQGLERLRVLTLADDGSVTTDHTIAMPDEVYSAWVGTNLEYDTTVVRYQYTSLVAPASAFDFDVTTQTSTLVRRQPVPGYEPERYTSRRLWASAPDGTTTVPRTPRYPSSTAWWIGSA